MARDEVTALNMLMIAAIALSLASHHLPAIAIDLSSLTWQAVLEAAGCSECISTDYMLAP